MNYYPLTRQARHNGSSFHGHVPARNQNTTHTHSRSKTIPYRPCQSETSIAIKLDVEWQELTQDSPAILNEEIGIAGDVDSSQSDHRGFARLTYHGTHWRETGSR